MPDAWIQNRLCSLALFFGGEPIEWASKQNGCLGNDPGARVKGTVAEEHVLNLKLAQSATPGTYLPTLVRFGGATLLQKELDPRGQLMRVPRHSP